MKTLFKLLILIAIGVFAYLYFVPGAKISDITDKASELKDKIAPGTPQVDPVTGKPLVDCTKCQGSGLVKCSHTRCKEGKIECNGPCMRLTKGTWVKNASLGKGPDELWQAFPQKGGTQYYSKAHVGEVVEMQNGMAVNLGKCKICDGTTLMPCTTCKGTASITCSTCKGRKQVPDPKAANPKPVAAVKPNGPDNTKPASIDSSLPPPPAPETIRLKNGKTITGNIVIRDSDVVVIRTPDGKTTQVAIKDLATP